MSGRRSHKVVMFAGALFLGGLIQAPARATLITRTVELRDFTLQGWTFHRVANIGDFPRGSMLQSVSMHVTLTAGAYETFASDLTWYVGPYPVHMWGALQVGGFIDPRATTWLHWTGGDSEVVGTVVNDTKFVGDLGIDLSRYALYLGHAYVREGTFGTWNGEASVTYLIPEPRWMGALAPAGLLLGRRRRA